MTLTRTLLASAAALGLAVAPIAAQAGPVRSATLVTKSERLSNGNGNAAVYAAAAAFAIAIAIILATTDNGHGRPASPG